MKTEEGSFGKILKEADFVRHAAIQFAPPRSRPTLRAIAAATLEIAAIPYMVKEPAMGQVRVAWWRETLDRAAAGQPPQQPTAQALAAAWREEIGNAIIPVLSVCEQGFKEGVPREKARADIEAVGQQAWLPLLGVNDSVTTEAALHAGYAWAWARESSQETGRTRIASHLTQLREALPNTSRAAMPALLPGAAAAQSLQRAKQGRLPASHLSQQALLLTSALLRRF